MSQLSDVFSSSKFNLHKFWHITNTSDWIGLSWYLCSSDENIKYPFYQICPHEASLSSQNLPLKMVVFKSSPSSSQPFTTKPYESTFQGKIVAQGKLLLRGPLFCTDDPTSGPNFKMREMTVFLFEQVIPYKFTIIDALEIKYRLPNKLVSISLFDKL